jgi:hypothetical protein
MALPPLEVGQVISFSYLWRREHVVGEDAGRKYRPVMVLAIFDRDDGGKRVLVLPFTTQPPADGVEAIDIQPRTMRRLGLDGDRSWLILTEANHISKWPGIDLGDRDFGNAGTSLHMAALSRFRDIWRRNQGKVLVPRD